MPIEHMNARRPFFGAVNSMTFSPRLRAWVMFRSGIVRMDVQPLAPSPFTVHRTGTPALIVIALGS